MKIFINPGHGGFGLLNPNLRVEKGEEAYKDIYLLESDGTYA